MIPKKYYKHFFILLLCFCKVYGIEKSSLTFVIDDTGSMYQEIEQVKEGVDRIFTTVLNSNVSQIEDVVLVTFKDKDFHPFYSSLLRTKTKDRDDFKRNLTAISVGGGGATDCPEDSMSGILTGIENSQPRSTIYIYTDASAKDYRRFDEVKNLAIKKQCKLIFVLTGDCDNRNDIKYLVYQDLADATSGLVYPGLNKYDVFQITNEIINRIESPKADIETKTFSSGHGDFKFSLDEKHMNATITVIGLHPTLNVFGPDSEVRKTETKVLINVDNVRTEQINDTKPGVYKVIVGSKTKTRVKVSAGTQVTFQQGFSTFKASSIKDTTTRPLPDVESYVHIQITDGLINLDTLRIIPKEGSVIQNIPLHVLNVNSKLYVTTLMKMPEHSFQIEIIGRDPETNKEIRRLGPPIEPQPRVEPKPKPPVVDIIGEPTVIVEYYGNIDLTCKIAAYPQPEVIWVLEDGTKVDGKVSLVEKPYEYISYMKLQKVAKNGTYYCKAKNSKYGHVYEDEKKIQIRVRSPFTIISTPPEKISLKYGEKQDIICNVKSPVPIAIEWFYQNAGTTKYSNLLDINNSKLFTISPDKSVIHIKSANMNHIGRYVCRVSLIYDNRINKSFETYLEIIDLKSPQIFVSHSEVTSMVDMRLKESCRANGIPEPEFTWKFKSIGSSELIPIQLKGGELTIPISYTSAGTYVCTATNAIGNASQTIEVTVHGKPEIVNVESEYKGVTGDKVLKIPCKVTGVPKPTITWKIADKPVISDSKITVDKSALFIKNPIEKDSNNFTCEAQNKYGFASKRFEATIYDFIDITDTKDKIDDTDDNGAVYLKKGDSADIKCRLPHSDPQSVRWYVNEFNTRVLGSTYPIRNAQYSNDGNYTCRVNTDQGSASLNTLVDIGYMPRFIESLDQSSTVPVDWNPTKVSKLGCLVRAKPRERVQWYYNGQLLKNRSESEMMPVAGWGQYMCKVYNPHGTIERTFNVTTSGCVINGKVAKVQKTPLLLGNTPGTWAELDNTENDFIILNQQQTVKLACSTRGQPTNTFKTHPESTKIIAQCHKEDQFIVGGKTYKFEELQCKDNVNPDKILSKKPCAGLGEITEVGFQLDDGFLRVYDVCIEDKKTVYVKTVMSGAYSEVSTDKNNGHIKKCQYNQQPLVKPVDVTFGPAQIVTLTDVLNTVKIYEPCDSSSRVSWSKVEDAVRYLFEPDTYILWTGASQFNNNVPRYLWKVVKTKDSIETIVYVNDPNPDISDIFCSTNTNLSDAISELSDVYTYVCTLHDFMTKFKLTLSDFETK